MLSCFKHKSQNVLWVLCLKQDTYERLKDSCMFMTGRWQILQGERAIRALTHIQHWQPLSSPFLFFPHFLLLSQFLAHTSFLSHLLALSHTHTFFPAFFLSGSLKVITSLRPVWRASRHTTRHQSLLIPSPSQLIWRDGFSDGTIHAGKGTFLSVFVFPAAGLGGSVWGERDCRSGGHQGAASPSAFLTDSVFCVLTSGGNRAALFPQPPCSTGISCCRVQWGLDWRKT